MPTGQTPAAMFKGLDYGDNVQVNDAAGTLEETDPSYATPDESGGAPPPDFTPGTDEETFLYSPSDRPEEPITHGAPFGDGSHYTRHALESESDFARSMSAQLTKSSQTPEVRKLAARLERGL